MKQELLDAVQHELIQLKAKTTKKEKSRLNIDMFNPDSIYRCIYGQLTGSCETIRTRNLMKFCCEKIVSFGDFDYCNRFTLDDAVILDYNNQTFDGRERTFKYMSCLEFYIIKEEAKIQEIFNFLTNKIQTIKL